MKKLIFISAFVLFVASYSFAGTSVMIEKAPTSQIDDNEKKAAENTEDNKKEDAKCEKKEESCDKKESSCCKK
jgi:hypothetical protein